MIVSLQRVCACLLVAGLMSAAACTSAVAEPRATEDGQQEIGEVTGGADEAPPHSATTTVTAYIEAEPEPDNPAKPESSDEKDGLVATGDPGAGVAYVLLAGGAGMIALGRVLRER